MKSFIHKYKNFSFEERTIFSAKFSIIFNTILGISKIILSIFKGVFFLVSGVLNIFILMAKLECYLGVSHSHKKTFKYRNNFTGVFMILAGVQYAIYMGRMLYADVDLTNYGAYLIPTILIIRVLKRGSSQREYGVWVILVNIPSIVPISLGTSSS